jgi:hypothetical protein
MYTYIHMCVYKHTRARTHTHARTHARTHTYVYIYTYIHTRGATYALAYMFTSIVPNAAQTSNPVVVCTYVCVNTIQPPTYTHTHTHTHTHTQPYTHESHT